MSYVLMWDKEIPPEDRKNSSEMRLCRISYELFRFEGEICLSHTNTFSRPLCDFLRIFGVTNEFSRWKTGVNRVKHITTNRNFISSVGFVFIRVWKISFYWQRRRGAKQRHKSILQHRGILETSEALMCETLRDAGITVYILTNVTGCPKMNLNSKQNMGNIQNFNVWKLFCITFVTTFR